MTFLQNFAERKRVNHDAEDTSGDEAKKKISSRCVETFPLEDCIFLPN